MTELRHLLQGLWLPLVTPFRDGELDEASLRRLVRHYAAGPIDGLRAMIRGHWYPDVLAVSSVMSVLLFVVGIFYFRKTERRFADIA